MSLEELVAESSALLSGLVSKPKMTEKLLARPPFRFLHDTFLALNANNGMFEHLLTEAQKDSATLAEKADKIAFLDAVISFTGICKGAAIDVRSGKIVAGSEAENTNMLLIAIAQVANDSTIDYEAAAAAAKKGASPGPVPRKGASKPRKAAPQESKEEEPVKATPSAPESKEQESKQQGPEPDSLGFDLSQVNGEWSKTIQLYQGLISKPKLSEKLLSKPPFRFLHDMMSSLNENTKILEGLFQGDELDAKNFESKEQKLTYLDKLIAFAQAVSGLPVEAKSSRIAAGQEPELTNKLLQTLACVAQNGNMGAIAASKAVSVVVRGGQSSVSESEKETSKEPKEPEKPEKTDKSRPSRAAPAPVEEKEAAEEEKSSQVEQETTDNAEEGGEEKVEGKKSVARPQTARKRPPKIKENASAQPKPVVSSEKGVVRVMMDGQEDSDDDERPEENSHVRSNNSDGQQNLKGKLAREILQDEQKSELLDREEGEQKESSSQGITMGKIGQSLRKQSTKAGSSAAKGGFIDVDKVSSTVQTLCQSTNPLGKCMDYVHEDLTYMSKELEKWRSEYRKHCDDLEDEQRATAETLLPLKSRLLEVEERIKDQLERISTLKTNVAKNDQRASALLLEMVLN